MMIDDYKQHASRWLTTGQAAIASETDRRELLIRLYNVERALCLLRREYMASFGVGVRDLPIDRDGCDSITTGDLLEDICETRNRVIDTMARYSNALYDDERPLHTRVLKPLAEAECRMRCAHNAMVDVERKREREALWRRRNPELPFATA